MISMIIGTVCGQERNGDIVVNASGVGYSVRTSRKVLDAVGVYGRTVTLYCRQVWSEALGPSLYGWTDEMDRHTFDLLLTIDGVGPVMASRIVGGVDHLDVATEKDLMKIDGVGKIIAGRVAAEWPRVLARAEARREKSRA